MIANFKNFIGARVVKTSVAAGLALYFASFLHFTGFTYAVLVAVLATQKSLARSLGLAKYQVTSALIGTISGNLVAYQFGTYPLIAGLLVFALFTIHLRLGWKDTIFLSIVTATNSFSTFDGELIVHSLKQIAIVLIGISCSILVNFVSVPKYGDKLDELMNRAEAMLRGLVYLLYENLSHINQKLSLEEMNSQVREVRKYIQEARHYAELMFEDEWIYNRKGREAQQAIQVLKQMELLTDNVVILNKALEKVNIWVDAVPRIQKFIDVILHVQTRVIYRRPIHKPLVDKAITRLDLYLNELDMPKTRLEFMSRASLYHFYLELKEYYNNVNRIREQE